MIKKLRHGNITVVIRNDKILFCPKNKSGHYTFHFGPKSKVFDSHLTVLRNTKKRHKTIFEIPHETAFKLMLKTGLIILLGLKNGYRSLNLKWMEHNNIGAVVMRRPDNSQSEQYMVKRGGYHEFDMAAMLESVWEPDYLDELFMIDENEMFLLFSCKMRGKPKKIGSGFLLKNNTGQKRLIWLPDSHVTSVIKRAEAEFEQAFQTLNKPFKADAVPARP